jgi:arylsulfatase A-like enzyme
MKMISMQGGGKASMNDGGNAGPGQSRRDFLKLGTGAMAGLVAHPSTGSAREQGANKEKTTRPNFLFLVGEGLRHDEFSFAGNPIIQTPNLDRLGYEGINFKNAFVINALCSPSRATLLTGLYSHTTGCIDNQDRPIPAGVPIFTDLLHEAGYDTGCFGKVHIGNALKDRHWDAYCGFDEAATDYYNPRMIEGGGGNYREPRVYEGYVDDILTSKAVSWLKQERDKPFFCLFMFQAPHAPFYRSRRNLDLYNGIPVPKPKTFDDDLKGFPGKPRAFANAQNKIGTTILGAAPRSLEEVVKDHYAGVVNNDQNFRSLLEALESSGKLDDTVIVLTSDHGFFLGEWRCYDKRFMHEPSIRVPLLIRYPKLIPAGTVVEQMALNLDLAPTMLELAGLQVPRQMQGRSLVPFLNGSEPAQWREDWLYEYYEYPSANNVPKHRGIRTARYKLIHYYLPPEEFELYDLQNDPEELFNLYGESRYRGLTETLRRRLEELRRETGDPAAGRHSASFG